MSYEGNMCPERGMSRLQPASSSGVKVESGQDEHTSSERRAASSVYRRLWYVASMIHTRGSDAGLGHCHAVVL